MIIFANCCSYRRKFIGAILSTLFLIELLTFRRRLLAECTMAIAYGSGHDAPRWYTSDNATNYETFVPWIDFRHISDTSSSSLSNNKYQIVYSQQMTFPQQGGVLRVRQTDEERLTSMLFQYYASSLRPVYNSSESVNVQFGLNLIQIQDMDEVNQVLEISAWLEMTWLDERLRWDPVEFSGLKMIRLPTRLLWVPDIVLYNSADDFDRRTKAEEVRAMIAHSGEIFLGPYTKLRSTCILDLTLYPYDEQKCTLVFGSWTYDSSQLVVYSKAETVELSQYIESAKWELIESSVVHAERKHTCCRAPYSDIIISIKMRRRFLYNNLFDIFIPTVWLSLLCLLCFYLAPESGEKITLGITVLLTFTLFTWMIAENTPRTSDFVPLISIYLTVTMSLSAVVVGLQVFMLNVHGMTPVLKPVPHIIRVIVIDGIARFLRIENVHKDKNYRRRQHRSRQPQTGQRCNIQAASGVTYFNKQLLLSESNNTNNLQSYIDGVSPITIAAANSGGTLLRHQQDINRLSLQRQMNRNKTTAAADTSYSMAAHETQGGDPSNNSTSNNKANAVVIENIVENIAATSHWPGESFSDQILDEHFDNIMKELVSSSRLRFIAREAKFFDAVEHVIIGENEEPYLPPPNSSYNVDNMFIDAQRLDHRSTQLPIINSQQILSPPLLSSQVAQEPPNHSNSNKAAALFEDELLLRLMQSVAFMSKREQSDAITSQIANEWRLIAVVFDRLAFYFFFIFTLLSTFGLLVLVPLTQETYPKPWKNHHHAIFNTSPIHADRDAVLGSIVSTALPKAAADEDEITLIDVNSVNNNAMKV